MSKVIDMVGKKFDMMLVRARGPDVIRPDGRHKYAYYCDCDCGTKDVLVCGEVLRNKSHFHSCGCHKKEILKAVNTKHGDTPGGHWNRLYRIWSLMKDRCNNPNTQAYKDYGARGIRVCDEWLSYIAFKEWAMTHGYEEALTIDRIDVNKGYQPDNCRWVSMSEQAKNRRFCVYITIDGVKHHMAEWGRIYHIQPTTISARIRSGWDPVRAVTTPVAKRSNNAIV